MTCVSVRHNISACSNLLSFESANFKELPEVHEIVKFDNCLSFRNLWYSGIALGSALGLPDKVNEPFR